MNTTPSQPESSTNGTISQSIGSALDPEFEDPLSKRLWDDYFDRVKSEVAPLRPDVRRELIQELKVHLLESIQNDDAEGEPDRVFNATARMGRPEEYLQPIVTDRMIEEGSTTYNPFWILRGLGRTLMRGAKTAVLGVLFGLGYLFGLAVTSMAVLKPFFPDHIGLFYDPTQGLQQFAFGIIDDPSGMNEVLGYWVIPVSLLLGALIYASLTKMLVLLRVSD